MEVGDEATNHLSKRFRDSLPTTTGTVWSYILGKMDSAANASLPHLKKAGRLAEEAVNASLPHLNKAGRLAEEAVNASLRLAEEAVNASLPHLKKAGRLAEEAVNASIPHLKKAGRLAEQGMNASLSHLKKAGSLAEQGVNASLPHLKKVGGMAQQGVKSAAAFTEDGVRATLPYVRTSLDYSVEKAKQHPYLFGSLALIILFKLFRGGSWLAKTMKAPGQNIRIPRTPFESNPKAYFSDLRALKGK